MKNPTIKPRVFLALVFSVLLFQGSYSSNSTVSLEAVIVTGMGWQRYDEEVYVSGLEPGKDIIVFGKPNQYQLYPWQGEDSIHLGSGVYTRVNERVVGVNYLISPPLGGFEQDSSVVTVIGRGENFPELKRFSNLEVVSAIDVSDEDLIYLKNLPNLKALNVHQEPITDEGLKSLLDCKNLTWLDVGSSQISEEGLNYIVQMKQLRTLDIGCLQITDGGVAKLKALKDLRELDLGYTLITDEGLKRLQKLQALQKLDLSGCDYITDQGLSRISLC